MPSGKDSDEPRHDFRVKCVGNCKLHTTGNLILSGNTVPHAVVTAVAATVLSLLDVVVVAAVLLTTYHSRVFAPSVCPRSC